MEWDESQEFPLHVFKEMGKLGLMGVLVPEEYGGSGLGYFEYNVIIQEIAKVCGSIGLSLAAHNSLCTNHILTFASEQQKQKYLRIGQRQHIGAWGLTEPIPAAMPHMQTTAIKDGDDC
jgi:alkylation response protein AidB-like acyl-CoA dehydrogenase